MSKARLKSSQDFALENKLSEQDLQAIDRVSKRYAVSITPHIMGTINGPVGLDPVASQYVPQMQELKILPEENPDPIGDDEYSPVKGIVHRYPDRLLLKLANVCAVYCRYCFRREKVGPGSQVLTPEEKKDAYAYIASNPDVWEVILTGGDPLILSPRHLKESLDTISAIPHVQVIRFHTRIPVADPARITSELCEALNCHKAVYVVVHVNHPNEITTEVKAAFHALHAAGCVLLSQSVLLKGINDNADILEELFRTLASVRVKPYYLHHPDLAPGTSHFRLPLWKGQEIMKKLLGRLSGICRPHYMLDIPGGHGKVPVTNDYIERKTNNTYTITDYKNNTHLYQDSHD